MLRHWRTLAYLAAAGLIWFAEGYVFTRAFGFDTVQTAAVSAYFAAVFALAIWITVKAYRRFGGGNTSGGLSPELLVSMAPALTLILGSFAALPIFMAVLIARAALS